MTYILVAREHDDFSEALAGSGIKVLNCPTITTSPIHDLSTFERNLDRIHDYDGVFLTSRKATEIFRRKINEKKIVFSGRIYVFGRRGFNLLRNEGLDLFTDDSAGTVQEMLDAIDPEELTNKRFLIICGEKTLSAVSEFLAPISNIDQAVVYHTAKVLLDTSTREEIRMRLSNGEVEFACFFSPSGVESFLEQFGSEILERSRIAVIGKTTADYFLRRNVNVDFMSQIPTALDFAEGLIHYQRSLRLRPCLERL